MFDDRLVVQSPGDYPAGVHPREFIHNPANPRLMDGMRYLKYVRMASEGSLRMRQEMGRCNLPVPEFSLPGKPYVRLTLFNDVERRLEERRVKGKAKEFANLFRITWKSEHQNASPTESDEAPGFREIKQAFIDGLKAQDYLVDSFAMDTAVRLNDEQVIPALKQSKLASIYAGFRFRILSHKYGAYLVLDHNIEVQNRVTLSRMFELAPEMRERQFSKGFVRIDNHWRPCRIQEIKDGAVTVRLTNETENIVRSDESNVLPKIPTFWIAELLRKAKVRIDLHGTVKKLSFNLSKDAARERAARTEEMARGLSEAVFPLTVRSYKLMLDPTPAGSQGSCAGAEV